MEKSIRYGRYDMKIEKRDGTLGIILEFKTVRRRKRKHNGRNTKTSTRANRRKSIL